MNRPGLEPGTPDSKRDLGPSVAGKTSLTTLAVHAKVTAATYVPKYTSQPSPTVMPPAGTPRPQDYPAPLYQWIVADLRQSIERGEWKPDQLVPSESQLARQFGVSPGTVKRALLSLVADGFLYRKQGKGTFVARANLDRSLRRFFRYADASGTQLEATSDILEVKLSKVPVSVAEVLELSPKRTIVEILRLRRVNADPIMLERSYLPQALFPGLERKDLSTRILYEILEADYGRPVLNAKEFLEPGLASKEEAGLLGIAPGSPVILIDRIALSFNSLPIEYRRGVGRGDKYRYYVELR